MRRIILTLTAVAALLLVATAATKTRKSSKSRSTVKTTRVTPPPTAQSEEPQEWALVNVAAACLRTEPSHSASLETQASYGTPAKVLSRQGEWYRLELPDGYKAWMISTSLVDLTDEQMKRWRMSPRVIVTQPRPASAYSDSINTSDGNVAFDIVLGSIFEGSIQPGS